MLSLLDKGIQPSTTIADAVTYFTAVNHLQSISGNCSAVVEKIKKLLSDSSTRLYGLVLLKIALKQNTDVYVKGNWTEALYKILHDTTCSNLKQHACEVLYLLLPNMAKELAQSHGVRKDNFKNFLRDIYSLLLSEIDDNVEWSKEALKCIHISLKSFPHILCNYKQQLTDVILKKISHSVSSHIFEIVADCFALLPNVAQIKASYIEEWKTQYLTTLNTLNRFLNVFLSSEPFSSTRQSNNEPGTFYMFPDDGMKEDIHHAFMKGVRRYINLCKCLAKMLSTQSVFAVEVPVKRTLQFTTCIFDVQIMQCAKASEIDQQVFYSCLSQMQLATLSILESLLLNFNMLPLSSSIAEVMNSAVLMSTLPNSDEPISQVRVAVWRFLKIFIKKYGSGVSGDVIKLFDSTVRCILMDISIDDKMSQSLSSTSSKSKKNAASTSRKKCLNENMRMVCNEALETLEQLIYTGVAHFKKDEYQEIFSKTVNISCTISTSHSTYPFPYDDDICRKNLYSVLLALVLVSNVDHTELIQAAIGLLKNGFQDPSIEVKGFCNIAVTLIDTKIHPERPPPKYRFIEQRQSRVSSAVIRCPEWTSDDFIPNLRVENAPEARTLHNPNDDGRTKEEPMDDDEGTVEEVASTEPHYSEKYVPECYISKYPEQGVENQQNGDDILELQSSNQCQDEESEEDEEDDDERSYGEEETNPGEMSSDNIYIPSTSKMQMVTPVHISSAETASQNVTDQEYEHLRSSGETETSSANDNNKNMHVNGVHSIVPDTDVPSSSSSSVQPTLANENGVVYPYDEEDLEDEDEDEDEEDETPAPFMPEKRSTSMYPPNPPPSKRQKMDNVEMNAENQEEERSRSPTLEEMKADFHCTEIIDDIKS